MAQDASPSGIARQDYDLRPIVFDAGRAHREGIVAYRDDGTAVCDLSKLGPNMPTGEFAVPTSHQYPAIRATFDDLNKTLSRLSNSPQIEDGHTLRSLYEQELNHYEEMANAAYLANQWEPDYGSYVFDRSRADLYLIAPKFWHRLALVTSNAMLLTDPMHQLKWRDVRARLESTVVGFAGLSVGSNVLEGWLREARPDRVKLADPDWLELPNLNRCVRGSIRHITASRASRFDPRNPYEVVRTPKIEYLAYEASLVDPYLTVDLYPNGVNRNNIDEFLLGNGADEPRLDVLVEETDNVELKLLMRDKCRAYGIDVLMISDFGHRASVLWNHYAVDQSAPLGYSHDDDAVRAVVEALRSGERKRLTELIDLMCGPGALGEQFADWIEGVGEQPTSSIPQSGATAMSGGGVGGKEIALHVLGHRETRQSSRVVYDFLNRKAID